MASPVAQPINGKGLAVSDIPLREYVDRCLADLELRLSEQRSDLKERLASMNEFRDALRDQSAKMATRDSLDELRDRIAEVRQHAAVTAALVSLAMGVIVAVLAAWLTK